MSVRMGVSGLFRAAAICLAVVSFGPPAEAKLIQTVKVRYETRSGPSKWYEMDVTFVTGTELNEATNSYSYRAYNEYAVIFFGQGQAAVIELKNNSLFCGPSFDSSCLPALTSRLKGSDQDGTEWELCTGTFC